MSERFTISRMHASSKPIFQEWLRYKEQQLRNSDYLRLPRDAMPDLMAKCQALHLLNIHQEPFTRGFLEALVSGLAEVGRMPGGANEVI